MDGIRPDSTQTQRLLDAAAAGDGSAVSRLLRRHLPRVKAAVARRVDGRLRARIDADDIVQETQIEVVNRLPNYLAQRPLPFHLWLRRATHQQLLKAERRHLQTLKRSVDRELPLPDRTSLHLAAGIADGGRSPTSQAERRELAARVRRELSQLPERDREVLMLRNFEGLSNAEVACLLEITSEAAKKRYARALLRLQELLSDLGSGGNL